MKIVTRSVSLEFPPRMWCWFTNHQKISIFLKLTFHFQIEMWEFVYKVLLTILWKKCHFEHNPKCPSKQSLYPSALDFCNSPVWNIQFDELDFFPSLNWIFLPAVACTIQDWNRLKIKLIKLDISNWRIVKIKCRWIELGGMIHKLSK